MSTQNTFQQHGAGFDLTRLSRSKQAVDLAPNTVRAYARQGLNIYRMGKAAFFSKAELEQFIRTRATVSSGPAMG
jgi:hypothetical protein